MVFILDEEALKRAFEGRDDLTRAIKLMVTQMGEKTEYGPALVELQNKISQHINVLKAQFESGASGPASKKRKLDDILPSQEMSKMKINNGATKNGKTTNDVSLILVQEISMAVPLRKKVTIDITPSHIQARDANSNEVLAKTIYRWDQIASAFCLPVPDKAQKQFNYVFFVKGSELVTKASPDTIDALVFTISATAPKPGTIFGSDMAIANTVNDEYKTLFDYYITQQLKAAGNGVTIQEGNAKIFHSAIKEAHRPKEPAIHVKAFRGSKDGYIYFLPNGILWAFKKPLMFIPLNQIVAVSYVAVLQRTFNVVVEVEHGNDEDDDEEREEIEFGMIDQEDYENVDGYMKRHGLDDASMADQRKAKRLGVNVVKNEDGEKVDVGDAGELQKAQQEAVLLQQADLDSDEDEGTDGEDFDPGSEGDSEGSGSSDDESDDDDEGGGEQNGDESDDAKYE